MQLKYALASASLVVLAACVLVLPTANAETVPAKTVALVGHDAAFEACSAINPIRPVTARERSG
ncbi:MAG: hypothetical protein ACAH04_01300 [Methylibium sp.]|jgi:hypothetical protein|nr:hypothetical protein [Methyloceanibacter sp.]